MKAKLNISLKTKLIILISILIGIIAIFIFIYFPNKLEEQALNANIDKTDLIARMAAYSISPALLFGDKINGDEVLKSVTQNKDVVYIVVVDNNGKEFISYYKPGAKKQDSVKSGNFKNAGGRSDAIYQSIVPIRHLNSEIGKFYLGISLDKIRNEIEESRRTILFVSLFVFAFGIIIIIFISTAVTKPLISMVNTVEQIADGDISKRADYSYKDEIGVLAKSFNKMVDNLEAAQLELKTMNLDLQRRADELQKEINVRKRIETELIAAKETAEEMNRLKTNFLHNMSHEIRTPLAGILGYSQLIFEEVKDEDAKDYSERILHSAQRLMNTINSILDLSRIEANKMELELKVTNLFDEVNNAFMILKPIADKKNLYLQIKCDDTGISAKLDEYIFNQIINNLVGNAIKFTKKGGITVEIKNEILNDKLWTVVNIIDTGIGIPKESLSLIFEEFRQASEGLNREYEGSGLGLTITKRLVGMMDGMLTVESEENKGSKFSVYFPAPGTEPEKTTAESPFFREQKHAKIENNILSNRNNLPRVLLVENDIDSIEITIIFLKNICNVDIATEGETALNLARGKIYDAVLMDINLGYGMNGIEVTKEMRKIKSYENVPIIALTAYAMESDKTIFLGAGCTHYLSKPFMKEDIIKLMVSVLSKGSSGV